MNFFYALMVAAFGGTVGVLSAITISSTSNTIIEIAAGILIGGGGVYALLRGSGPQNLQLGLVGKLGCLFLLFFWGTWAGTKYLVDQASNPWSDQRDPVTASLIWEAEALSKSLGIGFRTYTATIDAVLPKTSQPRPDWCDQDPVSWVKKMDAILGHAKVCASGEDKVQLDVLALDMKSAQGAASNGQLSRERASELTRLFWEQFPNSPGLTSAAERSCPVAGDLSPEQKVWLTYSKTYFESCRPNELAGLRRLRDHLRLSVEQLGKSGISTVPPTRNPFAEERLSTR